MLKYLISLHPKPISKLQNISSPIFPSVPQIMHKPFLLLSSQSCPLTFEKLILDYRGIKSPKWHQKSRPRYKEYPQMAMQQPMPFPPPVVLYDPLQSHLSAPLPSLNPVYLQTPTCYSQPCPTDTFTYNSTVLPQPYYKPPEPPQFCIIHDRSPVQGQLSDQGVQQAQQPYYPVPTTYTKTRPCGNSTGYSTGLGSSCHGQSHSNFINYSTEKIAPVATIKTQHELLYPERNSLTRDSRLNESIFEVIISVLLLILFNPVGLLKPK